MFVTSPKRGRTSEEIITDRFLVLYMINKVRSGIGKTKLQKLVYLSEMDMKLQGQKGFNFNFVKLPYGPYSADLKNDIKELQNLKLISKDYYKSTRKGSNILKNFDHIIQKNGIFFEKIDQVIRKYANIDRDILVHIVHEMKNLERPWLSIKDTKQGSYILKKLRITHQDRAFQLSENDIAELEIYLDSETYYDLVESLQEAKSQKSIPLSEVI